MLTTEALMREVDYCPETGVFRWLASRQKRVVGTEAGSFHKHSGYRYITIDGKKHLAHRLAWLYVHGVWPASKIDHRDGNRANNRIKNLRDATQAVNSQNLQGAHSDSEVALLGVSMSWGKFEARIHTAGVTYRLGRFDSPDAAHAAYVAAKAVVHPEARA
jgi:hypothetical protein